MLKIFALAALCGASFSLCAEEPAKKPDAAPAQAAKPAGAVAPDFAKYVPEKPFKATLMRLVFDKSAGGISARFNDSIAKSPEWFKAYLLENKGVKPLPYHQNFGITEEEYKKMLEALSHHELEPVLDLAIAARRLPDGVVELSCEELGKGFGKLLIDERDGKLKTPWLDVDAPDSKNSGAASDGNPFGDWDGVAWKRVQTDVDKGDYKSVALFLGRSKTANASFLSLRVKIMESRKITSNFETILQFQPRP